MATSANELNTRGAELHAQGNLNGAREWYDAALRLEPSHFNALMNSAEVASRQHHLHAAAVYAARALSVSSRPVVWANYGSILMRLERYAEAKNALLNALEQAPDNFGAWHNMLLLYLRQRQFADALQCYHKLVALGGADNPNIQHDVAHIYLGMGDLPSAYPHYEARWHFADHSEAWDLHIPEWAGENLAGKSLLIHAEQGYGDSIMLARFLRDPRLPLKTTVAVPAALVSLFELEWPKIKVVDLAEVNEEWARGQQFDFHTPFYSLLRWLGITSTAIVPLPYITTHEVTVPAVAPNMFNVGICWASGPKGARHDWRRRKSDLRFWLPLGEIPGVCLWSLYPGVEAQDEIARLGAQSAVYDLVSDFLDFAETAALIAKLDLVISVDTAVVHLAGAMRKPVWMLSQYTPCWRWWDIGNTNTGLPWYDNMVIITQRQPSDWKPQLDEARLRLTQLMNKSRP